MRYIIEIRCRGEYQIMVRVNTPQAKIVQLNANIFLETVQ